MTAVEMMDWRRRIRKWLASVPWWLWFVAGIVLGAAVLALLLGVSRDAAFPAILALFGVILGGTIAAGTNLIMAQASRRAQIVATTWPRRIETHQAAFARWWRIRSLIFDKTGRLV